MVKDKIRDFKTKKDYQKWLSFGHMHHKFDKKGCQKIRISGKIHKVKH